MKARESARIKRFAVLGMFPSPCGVLGMKVSGLPEDLQAVVWAFPSPCGVLGMKVVERDKEAAQAAYQEWLLDNESFRPLAGF
jgi:hypothetical protein